MAWLLAALAAVNGCSLSFLHPGGKPASKAAPPPAAPVHTATLTIVPETAVASVVKLPKGFAALPNKPPLWLAGGGAIALVGKRGERTVVLILSGPGLSRVREAVTEAGRASTPDRILDVAASPNGSMLALARQSSSAGAPAVELHVLGPQGDDALVGVIAMPAVWAGLSWVDPATLAVLIKAAIPSPGAPAAVSGPGGLYLAHLGGGQASLHAWTVRCPLSPLSWSPSGRLAIGQGDGVAPPVLLDVGRNVCEPFNTTQPIRVVSWAPDSSGFAFLGPGPTDRSMGIFRYDIARDAAELLAVSSAAAAYIRSGDLLVVGNHALSWGAVQANPSLPVVAEIALFNRAQPQKKVLSLGVNTTPVLLAASTMTYSPLLDLAALELYAASPAGPMRVLLAHDPAGKTTTIGYGEARGVVLTAWAPGDGRLAILESDGQASDLAVVLPRR
jgi:hypothetical protein